MSRRQPRFLLGGAPVEILYLGEPGLRPELARLIVGARDAGAATVPGTHRGAAWRAERLPDATVASLLTDRLLGAAHSYLLRSGVSVDRARLRLHAWATILEEGGEHIEHTHPGAWLSGVYYVQVPRDAGRLVLRTLESALNISWRQLVDNSVKVADQQLLSITPRSGQCVLFPPWTPHRVESGRGPRIAVPFNVVGER